MKDTSTPIQLVEILTPKKFALNGLWFGPKRAKKVVIFIHGLTGSAFSARNIVHALEAGDTAVLTFNNRGFEQVGDIKRKVGRKPAWKRAGAGYEVFTESADDVQGAVNFARRAGAKAIYLAGHSTGAQKAVYWAAKSKNTRGVKGIVLFGPLSDYASALEDDSGGKLKRAADHARARVKAGRPHELMPPALTPWFVCDCQRFLSLYTPDSKEEIFTYAQPQKKPSALRAVKKPILVFLAGADEHSRRPAKTLAAWFEANISVPHRIVVVPRVRHGFKGGEKQVAKETRRFIAGK